MPTAVLSSFGPTLTVLLDAEEPSAVRREHDEVLREVDLVHREVHRDGCDVEGMESLRVDVEPVVVNVYVHDDVPLRLGRVWVNGGSMISGSGRQSGSSMSSHASGGAHPLRRARSRAFVLPAVTGAWIMHNCSNTWSIRSCTEALTRFCRPVVIDHVIVGVICANFPMYENSHPNH
jgi:hypothetical protein